MYTTCVTSQLRKVKSFNRFKKVEAVEDHSLVKSIFYSLWKISFKSKSYWIFQIKLNPLSTFWLLSGKLSADAYARIACNSFAKKEFEKKKEIDSGPRCLHQLHFTKSSIKITKFAVKSTMINFQLCKNNSKIYSWIIAKKKL